jgi:tRNA modification GTPase
VVGGPTIVAVATGPAAGGVGVVRLSGAGALAAARPLAPAVPEAPEPRRAYLTAFVDEEGRPLDEGLFLFFRAPHSYTGEDVVELQAHGSPRLLELLVQRLLTAPGVRSAEPGEFTRRAFLNGRLDLARAEAVADLVAATSEAAVRAAAAQGSGTLSARVRALRRALVDLRAGVEGALDFPDEAAEADLEAAGGIAAALVDARALLADAQRGHLVRRGAKVVLFGPVNAGKSTLFNQLVGEERALVDAEPGTTRDAVEARLEWDGLGLSLVDTAGLRGAEGAGRVEAKGIDKTRAALREADLAVLLVPPEASDEQRDDWRREAGATPLLEVEGKADLTSAGRRAARSSREQAEYRADFARPERSDPLTEAAAGDKPTPDNAVGRGLVPRRATDIPRHLLNAEKQTNADARNAAPRTNADAANAANAAERSNADALGAAQRRNSEAPKAAERSDPDASSAAERSNADAPNAAERSNADASSAAERSDPDASSAAERSNADALNAAERSNADALHAVDRSNADAPNAAERSNADAPNAAERSPLFTPSVAKQSRGAASGYLAAEVSHLGDAPPSTSRAAAPAAPLEPRPTLPRPAASPLPSEAEPSPSPALPRASGALSAQALSVSGLTGEGVEALRRALLARLFAGGVAEAVLVTSERHADALRRAVEALERARAGLGQGTAEVAAGELGLATEALGEITGESAPDELIDAIFRRFCLGK